MNKDNNQNDKKNKYEEKSEKMFEDMIGNNIIFDSPIKDMFKRNLKHHLIYADFTASGKGLKSIESFISKEILPTYANVHSTVGLCPQRTTNFFEQSKNILRDYTNAYGNYSIIFHGQGTTGGIHKLIEILSLKKYLSFYKYLELAYKLKRKSEDDIKFKDLQRDLINEIENQFKELFINLNFCFKFKEKGNKSKYKCVLCDYTVKNEGGYYKHLNDESHNKKKEEFKKNSYPLFKSKDNKEGIYDFIDAIKKDYYKKDVIELINDYKKFKPIIFHSLFEHNSNNLSWKETGCELVSINPSDIDDFYIELEKKLNDYKDYYIKIGSFTATSNITGLLLDVDTISFLMHSHNGYAFFDYASGAPYLQMDVSGPLPEDYRELLGFEKIPQQNKKKIFKDGLFFSPHKFIGGPNTPGCLIVHDRIYRNLLKPSQPGGGTVHFVYKEQVEYIRDVELKEESGTPNIIGSIRLGLMIRLRQEFSHEFIIKKEEEYNKLFIDGLKDIPNLYILHNSYLENKVHLPIFSFIISYGKKYLHPNFVCALLNDFFGIQSRPGCSCAPNYGTYLLGVDKDKNFFNIIKKLTLSGYEIFKPGYCRLNLPFFYPKYIIEYIIEAIKFICKYGHLLLGMYNYDPYSGKFYLEQFNNTNDFIDLNQFDFDRIKNIKLYDEVNEKKISSEELKNIYKNVDDYINKDIIFLKETFTEELKPKINFFNFSPYDDSRWFLIFKDVEYLLKSLYQNKIMGIKDNQTQKSFKNENSLKEIKPLDWLIRV